MPRDTLERPIIKKVKRVQAGGHHGGAWKVAYADFVTAMMAFFLLMWLLSSTTEDQRKGIADYFSPTIPIAENSAGGRQMFQGDTIFSTDQMISDGSGGAVNSRNTSDSDHEIDDPEKAREEVFDFMAPPAPEAVEPAPEATPQEPTADAIEAAAAQAEAERAAQVAEIARAFEELKGREDGGELLEHLSMRITAEGLMIEVTETDGDPLFETGSAEPSALMQALMEVVAPIVAKLANDVAIVGHTDAQPFARASRTTNWELSTYRANSARRLLVANGLPEERLQRVTGAADREPISTNPFAPENRRIGIILLREELAPADAASPSLTQAEPEAAEATPTAPAIPE